MKKNYFLLLIFGFLISNAQQVEIRGMIKDSLTHEPIISASVGIKKSSVGTISNEEGIFQLSTTTPATVIISYLGYKTKTIPSAEFTSEIKNIVLQQSEEQLEEVMVTKIPLWDILKDLIITSTSRFNKPILLHTYYREFAKDNGKYTHFSDGLLDYHIGGTKKKTTSDLVVVQNRSASLLTPEEEEEEGFGSSLSIQNAVSSNYSMRTLYDNIVDKKRFENYDFLLKSSKDASGIEHYTISFEPKAGIKKNLFMGTVTYDPQSKLIQEIEMHSDPSTSQYARTVNVLIIKLTLMEFKFKAAYRMSGNNYILSYNNRYSKIRVFNKKRNYLLESRSDLLVTSFEGDNSNYDKTLLYDKRRLSEKPSHYTDKFWLKNNAIVLTSEEEKIINELEKAAVPKP